MSAGWRECLQRGLIRESGQECAAQGCERWALTKSKEVVYSPLAHSSKSLDFEHTIVGRGDLLESIPIGESQGDLLSFQCHVRIQSSWIDDGWTEINSNNETWNVGACLMKYGMSMRTSFVSSRTILWYTISPRRQVIKGETHGMCFFKVMSASENELSKPSILRFLCSSSSGLNVVLHCTGRNWTLCDRMMDARAGERACFLTVIQK